MKTNDATRANAEALPDINRRRMLLGLAAASTAAATATISTEAQATTPAENPKLIALFEELPAVAAAFHEVNDVYQAEYKAWQAETPWAPDELTVKGIAWPYEENAPHQPGDAEYKVLGGFLWRKGDDYPRRIVLKAWQVDWQITGVRRKLRAAKKSGNLADFMDAETEINRLKKVLATARSYEREFKDIEAQAKTWHEKAKGPRGELRDALEKHVSAIMDEPDFTMDGIIIKASALAEWDRVGTRWGDRLAVGREWHSQLAASILRYAQGGAA